MTNEDPRRLLVVRDGEHGQLRIAWRAGLPSQIVDPRAEFGFHIADVPQKEPEVFRRERRRRLGRPLERRNEGHRVRGAQNQGARMRELLGERCLITKGSSLQLVKQERTEGRAGRGGDGSQRSEEFGRLTGHQTTESAAALATPQDARSRSRPQPTTNGRLWRGALVPKTTGKAHGFWCPDAHVFGAAHSAASPTSSAIEGARRTVVAPTPSSRDTAANESALGVLAPVKGPQRHGADRASLVPSARPDPCSSSDRMGSGCPG